jgi:Zn-dependent protease with chaperone function/Tfp pilus assembly protein PilE
MMNMIYKNEKTLFAILLTLSVILWLGLIAGTFGIALIYLLFGFIFYCFAQSALISYLKGTGVKITADQFPDLKEKISACSKKLGLKQEPEAYLLHMNGIFNAFATRFLGRNFIVLYSDVVDAFDDNPDALNFYIGHEIGHIKRNHLMWGVVLFPAMLLPLIGAAYARAREYTCDRHGFAACANLNSAQFGLAALAAGGKRWRTVSKSGYALQAHESSGFWMSFHELLSDYPWLVKRMAAVKSLATGQEISQPRRNPLAFLLALFVPRLGLAGGAASGLIVIAIIGILAAVAIPAYQDYVSRAKLNEAVLTGARATTAVANYFYANNSVPQNLAQAGFTSMPTAVVHETTLNSQNGVVSVVIAASPYQGKSISFTPSLGEDKKIIWRCSSMDIPAKVLPLECRSRE